MSPWTAWQPWVIGAVAVAVMLWFVIRALFADTAGGRPRCLRCAHPFIEAQGLTCTECGWTARRPADLLRTRRHWGKATLAVVILLVGALSVRLIALGGNPLSILPSRFLVMLLPLDPSGVQGHGPIAEVLRRRLVNEELSTPTIESLTVSVAAGDGTAAPPSDAWIRRYGLLADEIRSRHAPRESPNHARLLTIPPRIEVDLPAAWPAREPVPASMTIRDWWPAGAEAIVTLENGEEIGPNAVWHRVGYRNQASIRRRHHFTLPATSDWPTTDTLRASLEVRTVDPEAVLASEVTTWRDDEITTAVTVDVEVDRPRDLPRPPLEPWAGDATTDELVADVFRDGLRRWAGATRPFAIRFNPRRLQTEALEGVFFGFVVEIVERLADGDEIVQRRTRIWMPGGESIGSRQRAGWTISEEDTAGLAGAFDPDSTSIWFMRITGDESLAALSAAIEGDSAFGGVIERVPDGPIGRWWSGTIERPLRTESAEGNPFVRMWFRPEGVAAPTPRR